MTESSVPPPSSAEAARMADHDNMYLGEAILSAGMMPTTAILRSAAEAFGVYDLGEAVDRATAEIDRAAARRVAYAAERDLRDGPSWAEYFYALRHAADAFEEYQTDEDLFRQYFLSESFELVTETSSLAASPRYNNFLRSALSYQLGQSAGLFLRANILLNLCGNFPGQRMFRRNNGEAVDRRVFELWEPEAAEAVAFFLAAVCPRTSPHGVYQAIGNMWRQAVWGVFHHLAEGIEDCGRCEHPWHADEMRYITRLGEHWCDYCADEYSFHCRCCGSSDDVENAESLPDGDYICGSCAQEVTECDSCGERRWSDEDCSYCGYDSSQHDGNYGPLNVMYYSYKPEPIFFSVNNEGGFDQQYYGRRAAPSSDDGIFFGMELETNIRRGGNYAEGGRLIFDSALVQAHGFMYAKSDCTVSGPELVTHPATLAAHRKMWSVFPFRELTQQRWSGWAGGNAGIHIHVDRRAFRSAAHLARFQIYFGEWGRELVSFCGRNCSSYGYHGDNMRGVRRAVHYATRRAYPARGSAINYENRNTIEVRMFRSSLRESTVMAYLEFLHGLIRYSETHKASHIRSERGLLFATFADWMTENSNGNYDNAVTRITERVAL